MSDTSTPSAERPRRKRTGRVRAVLTVGLLVGIGAAGTQAFWTDSATLSSSPITSGRLDLMLDGALTGQGGTYTKTSFAIADMIPGEATATSFPVANGGSVALTYTATATASGLLPSQMTFQFYLGGTATNTGTAAAGNRNGTCTGTLQTGAPGTLTSTPQAVITPLRQLNAGSQETICIVARLQATAGNAVQGLTTTAELQFSAERLGAP